MSSGIVGRVLAGVAGLFSLTGAALAGDLLDVRFGVTNAEATRIVLDLSAAPQYELAAADQGKGRLTLELEGFSAAAASGKGAGHVGGYAVAANSGDAELTVEFARTAKVAKHFVLPPKDGVKHHRLVIDLETASMSQFLASAPARETKTIAEVLKEVAPPAETAEPVRKARVVPPTPAAASTSAELPIIVIDPGHGGADPGASSAGGVLEKTVTLAAAKELSDALAKTGRYKVVLTRADDSRLDVHARSKVAREAGAKLFISLHADAHDDPSVRGGSVYTVSDVGLERSAKEAKSQPDYVLNRELNIAEEPVLGGILFDVTQRENKTKSTKFADILVGRLKGVTPLVNNSHRRGDLFVLLSPDVPAVLFELAFISNTSDAANLTSEKWRTSTMAAVAAAIDEYFEAEQDGRHASLGDRAGNSAATAR